MGGAYLNASGTVDASFLSVPQRPNVIFPTVVTYSKSETVGDPLAGTEFRVFPIPHHPILEVNGEMRGMGFGSYGHFLEGGGGGGLNLGHVAIEAGYRAVNADIHNTSQTRSGIFAHFHGPIYSLVFRY